ncbi:MAG TPA: hypothetical protein GXZ82_03360 [Firmicutes bacterium]|jgi:hypothetical protein|nr:hypothetical protein [Bacillota bacterium]
MIDMRVDLSRPKGITLHPNNEVLYVGTAAGIMAVNTADGTTIDINPQVRIH